MGVFLSDDMIENTWFRCNSIQCQQFFHRDKPISLGLQSIYNLQRRIYGTGINVMHQNNGIGLYIS